MANSTYRKISAWQCTDHKLKLNEIPDPAIKDGPKRKTTIERSIKKKKKRFWLEILVRKDQEDYFQVLQSFVIQKCKYIDI